MHGLTLEVKSPRMDNVAFLSGVIEGFYGRPWLQHQRLLLFKQMSAWKLNTFLYAPKVSFFQCCALGCGCFLFFFCGVG